MAQGDRLRRGSRGGLGSAIERKLVINLGKQHDDILRALKERNPSATYGEIIREMMVHYHADLIAGDIVETHDDELLVTLKLNQLQTANLVGKKYALPTFTLDIEGMTSERQCVDACPICGCSEYPAWEMDPFTWECGNCLWGGRVEESSENGHFALVTRKLKVKAA